MGFKGPIFIIFQFSFLCSGAPPNRAPLKNVKSMVLPIMPNNTTVVEEFCRNKNIKGIYIIETVQGKNVDHLSS